jgi:hypothetical protein
MGINREIINHKSLLILNVLILFFSGEGYNGEGCFTGE